MGAFYSISDRPIQAIDVVTPSGSDVALTTDVRWLRCGSAANLILRAPNSSADVTIAVVVGEYVPVGPGTIIRNTGTTTTPIIAFGD